IVYALKCWHCIADDCDRDPDGNYKAVQTDCLSGQYCQKVYFEMYSTTDHVKYFSTVRGCAWDCEYQNDFDNCTADLYSSRGCIRKLCCADADLCNSSSPVTKKKLHLWLNLTCILTIYLSKYFIYR
ncbi:hypothetical protein KUTeg_017185, partial [Tegillarca granosa]